MASTAQAEVWAITTGWPDLFLQIAHTIIYFTLSGAIQAETSSSLRDEERCLLKATPSLTFGQVEVVGLNF